MFEVRNNDTMDWTKFFSRQGNVGTHRFSFEGLKDLLLLKNPIFHPCSKSVYRCVGMVGMSVTHSQKDPRSSAPFDIKGISCIPLEIQLRICK